MSTIKPTRLPKSRRSRVLTSENSGSRSVVRITPKSPSEHLRENLKPNSQRKCQSKSSKRPKSQEDSASDVYKYNSATIAALGSFLAECDGIRDALKRIWREARDHRAGSFVVASLMTNSAIAMLTNSATEFASKYPSLASFDLIMRVYEVSSDKVAKTLALASKPAYPQKDAAHLRV